MKLTDAEIDALLAGDLPATHPYASVQETVTRVRDRCEVEAAPAPSRALAHRLEHGEVGVRTRHAMPARARRDTVTPGPSLRVRAAAALAAVVAGLGVTGGLAAADALPPPLQDRVADLAEHVGIDLPRADAGDGEDVPPGDRDDPGTGSTSQPGSSSSSPRGASSAPPKPGAAAPISPTQLEPPTPTSPPGSAVPPTSPTIPIVPEPQPPLPIAPGVTVPELPVSTTTTLPVPVSVPEP